MSRVNPFLDPLTENNTPLPPRQKQPEKSVAYRMG